MDFLLHKATVTGERRRDTERDMGASQAGQTEKIMNTSQIYGKVG